MTQWFCISDGRDVQTCENCNAPQSVGIVSSDRAAAQDDFRDGREMFCADCSDFCNECQSTYHQLQPIEDEGMLLCLNPECSEYDRMHMLSIELDAFCKTEGIEPECAEELLVRSSCAQPKYRTSLDWLRIDYLKNFIDRWDFAVGIGDNR